jgi:hypothetical protein
MARADGKPEIQHYVPQLLLRNFSFPGRGKQEQIHVFDKQKGRAFSTGVDNIVAERKFYDFKAADGKEATLEDLLSELEAELRNVLLKLLAARTLSALTPGEKAWVSIFLAVQFLRTRNFREMTRQMQTAIGDKIERLGLEPSKVPGFFGPENEDEIKRFSAYFLLRNVKPYSQLLADKIWTLFETSESNPFWVGDNPLALHNDRDFGPYGNIGLAAAGIQIYLPLSPTITLGVLCPTIIAEWKANLESKKTEYSTVTDPRVAALASQLVSNREAEISQFELGGPVLCDADNVTFLNFLQAQWANRFVLANCANFGMAEKMLTEFPHYRQGIRLTF